MCNLFLFLIQSLAVRASISHLAVKSKTIIFNALGVNWINLKELKLTGAVHLDETCFEALITAAPTLETLALDG